MKNGNVIKSPEHGEISFEKAVDLIKEFLETDDQGKYTLTIGTDSEVKTGKNTAKFLELVTAIVIHKQGYGGRYFWFEKRVKNTTTLREKIYQEVLLSIDTAKYLLPELKARLNGSSTKYNLEIHIDVGEKGETREMIKEVIGIVSGNGFVAKTKPYSYAASNVADRHA